MVLWCRPTAIAAPQKRYLYLRERTSEGRKRAKARGVRFGRPPKLTPHQRAEALRRRADGVPLADIARSHAVDRSPPSRHLAKIKLRCRPIMSGRCAVHKKRIPPEQFWYKLWYILKAPRKEYSIGRRRRRDPKTGTVKYKQNSRPLRPGNRVKLFYLMRDMYLDKLAMAGGEGSELLRRIKYEALREYRNKNGWDDRRP
jgi:hypothetical protein